SRLLDAQEISPRARAYIIDDADDLIAHSDPATMNRLLGIWSKNADGAVAVDTTTDSYDTSLETVARLRRDPAFANGGVARIDLDGERQILQIAPVGVSGLFKGSV
ncbi:adenylate/guanylate cyclase domain-containing protein, partial [Rhizobium ruizarguesonis]